MDSKDPSKIVGILDFGDLTHTYLVVDLATTVAASLRGQGDPIGPAVEIVAGYNGITPLEEAELRILYDLIGARLTMLNISWEVWS